MKIRILQRDVNELRIEVEGEGHTLCNMLQKTLLEDERVEMAGYDMRHPLIMKSVVYLRTKGKRSPETAMSDAAKNLRKRSREFRNALERASKEYNKLARDS